MFIKSHWRDKASRAKQLLWTSNAVRLDSDSIDAARDRALRLMTFRISSKHFAQMRKNGWAGDRRLPTSRFWLEVQRKSMLILSYNDKYDQFLMVWVHMRCVNISISLVAFSIICFAWFALKRFNENSQSLHGQPNKRPKYNNLNTAKIF